MAKVKMQLDRSRQSQQKTSRCVSTLLKPLRIFQFFAALLLFVFTIYMIVMVPTPMSHLVCILLIVLSGAYVFVLAVDLISYFARGAIHIIPMSIFSLLGLLFFGIAGILLICNAYTQLVIQIVVTTLCLLTALLFLIDITMLLAFWRRRCSVCKRCCGDTAEFLLRKDEDPRVTPITSAIEIMKHDVTTSLSDVRVPRELEDIATPDHSYRKIEYPQRREYIDRPTCVPSICNLGVAQIQTEPNKVSVVESQTPNTITKETPMQTLSKCEFCYQQLNCFHSPSVNGGSTSTPQFQNLQPTYPAIVQFIRGEVGMPCCPGCTCGTQQRRHNHHHQSQQLTPKRLTLEQNPSRALTSETTQQVANPAYKSTEKKLTEASETVTEHTPTSHVKSDKKPQALSDATISKRKVHITEMKRDVKPANANVDQEFDEKNERTYEESVKREGEDLIDEIERDSDKIERSKGGGEHGVTIYQQFMCVAQENIEESTRHNVATQMSTMLITPVNSRTKPRTFLHLKLNKVDPVKDTNVADENLHKRITSRTTNVTQAAQTVQYVKLTESSNPIEHEDIDYSLCKQHNKTFQSLKPISDNSRYHTAFKDKKGRYFCEFCAPLESKKITSRLEGMDWKKLKCANCKFLLRERRVKTNGLLKSDACSKCG
ncbi:uncharacterized protein [Linepithema humile]|uniref:uncharacterized protein isoform X4 n=1 Tax=Linepithema humile TaxID=83485 RepID=UPI00351E1C75